MKPKMSSPPVPLLDEIYALPKYGDGICFHRMQNLLRSLFDSDWGSSFESIRVTGSNGKGSVTSLVHSILCELQTNCGRYTSPHLEHFNERIWLGRKVVSDTQLASAHGWVKQTITELETCHREEFGSFEWITAMGLRSFQQTGSALAVMEAGIGGRYDPTRLVPGSLVALTSIDLEHTDLLGATKELIAYDKLDLCPHGGTVVSIPQDAQLWERMNAYCELRGVNLVDAASMWQVTAPSLSKESPRACMQVKLMRDKRRIDATVPLLGTFQLENIAIACAVVELWSRKTRPEISTRELDNAIVAGLAKVDCNGRLQQISTKPRVFIDVGHTPGACARVAESVRTFLKDEPILLVAGVSHNKKVEEVLQLLVPIADGIICTNAYNMGESSPRIAEIVQRFAPTKERWRANTIEDAVSLANQLATERRMTILVCGGLFLAVEFCTAWHGRDPKQLRFY